MLPEQSPKEGVGGSSPVLLLPLLSKRDDRANAKVAWISRPRLQAVERQLALLALLSAHQLVGLL